VGSDKARDGTIMPIIKKNLIIATRVEQRSVRSKAVARLVEKQ
jgi:hypothetical protein